VTNPVHYRLVLPQPSPDPETGLEGCVAFFPACSDAIARLRRASAAYRAKTSEDLNLVTCPECLRWLADQTAKRLRQLAGDPLWEAALTRIPGETDDGFRTRIEAIMRRS